MYVASYVLKSGRAMSETLKVAAKEVQIETVKTQFKQLLLHSVLIEKLAIRGQLIVCFLSQLRNPVEQSCLSIQAHETRESTF